MMAWEAGDSGVPGLGTIFIVLKASSDEKVECPPPRV